jgi:hypothetical protein
LASIDASERKSLLNVLGYLLLLGVR